jgi:hypothetical protein
MDGLAADAIAASDVGDAGAVVEHLEHGLIPLFHEPELHQHDERLLRRGPVCPQRRGMKPARRGCSGVVEVAEPVSPRYRSRVRKVSPTYRSQCVAHRPELHSSSRKLLTDC